MSTINSHSRGGIGFGSCSANANASFRIGPRFRVVQHNRATYASDALDGRTAELARLQHGHRKRKVAMREGDFLL